MSLASCPQLVLQTGLSHPPSLGGPSVVTPQRALMSPPEPLWAGTASWSTLPARRAGGRVRVLTEPAPPGTSASTRDQHA